MVLFYFHKPKCEVMSKTLARLCSRHGRKEGTKSLLTEKSPARLRSKKTLKCLILI